MIPFVDPHFHLWDTSLRRYPWLDAEECAHLPRTFARGEWEQDTGEVPLRAAVHVQAEADHALDPLEEVEWVDALDLSVPVVQVAYADLRRDDIDLVLARLAAHPSVRGVRQEAWFDPASTRADVPEVDLLADPRWCAGLGRLAAHGLSLDLLVEGHQLHQASDVLAAHPDLTVVLDHLGLPGAGPEAVTCWRSGLRRLRESVPRAAVKLSGWSMTAPGWERASVPPYLEEVLEVFGPERCMLASNHPVEAAPLGYAGYWAHLDRVTVPLGDEIRDRLFRSTAREVYRIAEVPT